MKQLTALKTILGVGLFGLLFSGYLSYQEFFGDADNTGCDALGQPGTIFGYPPCIYGFFMYLLMVVLSALGLRKKNN
ncbi:MAG: hypothetical protein A2119_01855 [Candidatus Colwellbacteria bacterium GWA2_46_10]|uniref:Vitamin K epoxide reductase domain-containing protein n=1 Tax=Candidatus Colwellbacteria bacterium GWA2_46_10 TaxID=1797684 RepID=A0A1G1YWS4_9BACT|nr:MAG: hypothetical protein UW86_C0004G0020 [Microgenomates group bacterium GW2011_GWA1_Microgenomates_45_10]KKU18802.1 MAG: hypothetical protein UX29_C0017G0018 [Parcubacteria group bacterium GW2011_GWA2_46_10]OGY56764.1 MAG: hypothetical protein A2119_01855 [Candidatus Colwellbacteria bacterium GWA2_46_10]